METIGRLFTDIISPLVPVYDLGLSNGWVYIGFSLATFVLLGFMMSVMSTMNRFEKKPTPPLSEILWIMEDESIGNMFLWLVVVSAIWPIGILFLILFMAICLIYIPYFCLQYAYLYTLKKS